MPVSYANGESGLSVRNKINGIFGTESGALADPYELTFNIFTRYRTLTVNADIELALSDDPDHLVSQTFEVIKTTGDGIHVLSFPADWIMSGDAFNPTKIQRIILCYDGTYVEGVISTLDDAPDVIAPVLLGATMNGATTQTLDLSFSEAVNITTAGWNVTASGGAVTVSSVSSGSGTTTPKFTLSRSIGSSETLTVSYNTGTGNTLDLAGNELDTVTDQAVTNSAIGINLEVLFAGTTVDTSKGTVTNPDSANLTISQNDKLIFKRTTDTAVASVLTNYWRSVNTYTRGTFAVLMNRDTGFNLGSAGVFMYRVDANNDIAILQNSGGATVTIRIRNAASTVYSLDVSPVVISNRFKIVYNSSNQISFYYWNSSAWTQLGTTQTSNIGSAGNIQCCANSHVSDAVNDQFSFDSIYVTDANYTTVTP